MQLLDVILINCLFSVSASLLTLDLPSQCFLSTIYYSEPSDLASVTSTLFSSLGICAGTTTSSLALATPSSNPAVDPCAYALPGVPLDKHIVQNGGFECTDPTMGLRPWAGNGIEDTLQILTNNDGGDVQAHSGNGYLKAALNTERSYIMLQQGLTNTIGSAVTYSFWARLDASTLDVAGCSFFARAEWLTADLNLLSDAVTWSDPGTGGTGEGSSRPQPLTTEWQQYQYSFTGHGGELLTIFYGSNGEVCPGMPSLYFDDFVYTLN